MRHVTHADTNALATHLLQSIEAGMDVMDGISTAAVAVSEVTSTPLVLASECTGTFRWMFGVTSTTPQVMWCYCGAM